MGRNYSLEACAVVAQDPYIYHSMITNLQCEVINNFSNPLDIELVRADVVTDNFVYAEQMKDPEVWNLVIKSVVQEWVGYCNKPQVYNYPPLEDFLIGHTLGTSLEIYLLRNFTGAFPRRPIVGSTQRLNGSTIKLTDIENAEQSYQANYDGYPSLPSLLCASYSFIQRSKRGREVFSSGLSVFVPRHNHVVAVMTEPNFFFNEDIGTVRQVLIEPSVLGEKGFTRADHEITTVRKYGNKSMVVRSFASKLGVSPTRFMVLVANGEPEEDEKDNMKGKWRYVRSEGEKEFAVDIDDTKMSESDILVKAAETSQKWVSRMITLCLLGSSSCLVKIENAESSNILRDLSERLRRRN